MSKSVSDFVAASMNAVLNSEEHKSLFRTYKKASDSSQEHMSAHDSSMMPAEDKNSSMYADDNDARKKAPKGCKCGEKPCKCEKCPDCGEVMDSCSCWPANDAASPASMLHVEDSHMVDDHSSDMKTTAALDVAIDSLLTASAALDSVGMGSGSTLSLKLAAMVVEAKKKMSPAEKKKLMERLNKGKKKAPASSSSKSTSSSGSKSVSAPSKSVSKK